MHGEVGTLVLHKGCLEENPATNASAFYSTWLDTSWTGLV